MELTERLALPTFGEYARQWLAELLVSNLTPALVRRLWAGLSPDHPTVNARAYALLRAIPTTTVTDDLLASNPCRVRAALNPPTRKEIRPATHAELDGLVREMPDQFGALVLLWDGAHCGWGRCSSSAGAIST